MDPTTEILIKGSLTLIALAAIIIRHRRPGKLSPERAGALLWTIAIVAVAAWPNFGRLHGGSGIHHWEQFHYFLGSKYFPELRYDGLYVASLAAEREINLGHSPQHYMRDLRTNEVVRTSTLADEEREVRARFTPERWQAFVSDVKYFLRFNTYGYIMKIRNDHGYNPTPTWTFTARLFSRWPAASVSSLTALAWLDPLLLGALFVTIFRTYGSRVGCLSLIIFGLGYPWRFYWIGGAFLRQDWLTAVGVAICLLHRRKHLAAGGFIAYAAMVRVFPAAFLVGAAVLGLQALRRRQPVEWLGRIGAGFTAGVVVCLVAGSLSGIGTSAWPQFWDNLGKHQNTWLTNNVGLKDTLLYDGATMRRENVDFSLPEPWIHWQGKMNRLESRRRPVLALAAVFFLAAVVLAARRQALDQASVLGMVVVFAIVVVTCYYWVMLLLIPLGSGRWRPTAGWLALNTGLYALHLITPSFEMIYGLMSWGLLIFFLAWIAPDVIHSLQEMSSKWREA